MDFTHLACMACGAIGVWLALTSGKRRHEDEDKPIRLVDGCWFPKAKWPPPPAPPAPPAPASRPSETRLG